VCLTSDWWSCLSLLTTKTCTYGQNKDKTMGLRLVYFRIYILFCYKGMNGGSRISGSSLNSCYLCKTSGIAIMWILCGVTFRRNVSPPSSGQKNPPVRIWCEQVAADCHGTITQKTAVFSCYLVPQIPAFIYLEYYLLSSGKAHNWTLS
jgi:hypothetical protein